MSEKDSMDVDNIKDYKLAKKFSEKLLIYKK
jgi:hypothetical protein